jgi:hypothetical protein
MADSHRVSYAEGQRISAADLSCEQLYLLGLDARHNLGEHSPGVALGLVQATDLAGNAIVTTGVAIDALGRDLLSNSDVASPVAPGAKCMDLWIVYCLVPLRLRRPGTYDCSPAAFPRWREFGHIVASAGDAASDPVPPFDGAVFLGRVDCDSTPDVGYVGLMGQKVADPGARTWLQVGPANGNDRYGFLVNATDTNGASKPRLAVDRMGRNTFWGDLSLLGYQAYALLPSPLKGYLVKAEARMPGEAGEQIRARMAPGGNAGPALTLTFLAGGKPLGRPLHMAGGADQLQKEFLDFNKTSRLVSLSLIKEDPDRDDEDKDQAAPERLLTTQDTPLTATCGSLELQKWTDPPPAQVVTVRGCAPQTPQGTPSQLPTGISFTPPDQPVNRTPLSGASAAALTENGTPVVQMRLDLGQKKDNDPFLRLAIGAPDQNGDFKPWLTGDGVGNLHLVGAGTAQTPSMSLNVTGRIGQGPIQPDPTDTRFTALLVLAWLHGLQSSVQASTVVSLALGQLPSLIETGKAWQYQLTATNSGSVVVVADKLFETRSIAGQTLLTNIANQTAINPGASQVFTITHQAGDMGVTGNLSIEVRMSGKIGNFPWWKAVTAGPIPVVQSPTLDASSMPSSAPPGADFDYSFTITNPANVAIHLSSVTVREGNGAPQQLPIAVADLPQNAQETFGPVNHAGGIHADLPVQIAISFNWANGPASSFAANKTVVSLVDLDIQVQNITNPVPISAPWTYDLVLKNTGNQPLTIPQAHGLQQRLSSPTTPWVDIPVGAAINLQPGESHTEAGITATQVPVATHDFKLEIQPAYYRENRNWTPSRTTKDIHIP